MHHWQACNNAPALNSRVHLLKRRELASFPDSPLLTASVVRSIASTQPYYWQRLSTLFSIIGEVVVVLGFSPCGSYLCVCDARCVRFYDLVLCRDCLYPRSLAKALLHAQEISLDHCYIELMLLASLPEQCLSVCCSRGDVDEQVDTGSLFYTSTLECLVRLFHRDTCLLEGRFNMVLGRTKFFHTGGGEIDGSSFLTVLVVVNSSESLMCLWIASCSSHQSGVKAQTQAGNHHAHLMVPAQTMATANAPNDTAASANERYHVLEEHSDVFLFLEQQVPDTTTGNRMMPAPRELELGSGVSCVQCRISGTALSRHLMAKYFPLSLLLDFEIRVIGPHEMVTPGPGPRPTNTSTDVSGALTIAVSVQFQDGGTNRLEMHTFLVFCNPSADIVGVLRFCDLGAFLSKKKQEFSTFLASQSGVNKALGEASLLCRATDYYCFLYNRLTQWSRHHAGNMTMLSNAAMLQSAESVKQIKHPILPVVLFNDEDDEYL